MKKNFDLYWENQTQLYLNIDGKEELLTPGEVKEKYSDNAEIMKELDELLIKRYNLENPELGQTQPGPLPGPQPGPQLESQPGPQLESQPEPQLESQPEPQLESQPEPQLEPQPEPQRKSSGVVLYWSNDTHLTLKMNGKEESFTPGEIIQKYSDNAEIMRALNNLLYAKKDRNAQSDDISIAKEGASMTQPNSRDQDI